MNIVGENVLREAKTGLGSEIEGKDQDTELTQAEAEQKQAAKQKMIEETKKRRESKKAD